MIRHPGDIGSECPPGMRAQRRATPQGCIYTTALGSHVFSLLTFNGACIKDYRTVRLVYSYDGNSKNWHT